MTRALVLVALFACGNARTRPDGTPHSDKDCADAPIGGMGYTEYRWSYFGGASGPFWEFDQPIVEECCIPHTWGNCAN